MKLAAIVPIGYLDRHGYQHIYEPCLVSMADAFSGLFLVQSTPHRANVDAIMLKLRRLCDVWHLSNKRTWFKDDIYSIHQVVINVNLALQMAHLNGYDAAVVLDVNSYIPETNSYNLLKRAEFMLSAGQPFTWYYRGDQLGNTLFHASLRRPWIINLEAGARFEIEGMTANGERAYTERGDFSDYDAEMGIDVQLECTLQDLASKYNYVRCYHELVPKRSGVFDWAYWHPYFVDKYRRKKVALLALSPAGQEIARRSRPEFLSHTILREAVI